MPYLTVTSMEYADVFPGFLLRRLEAYGEKAVKDGSGIVVRKSFAAAKATAGTIVCDLKPFEMARLMNLLPVPLRYKKEILPKAVRLAHNEGHEDIALKAITEFMQSEELLIAEGFLRFRLPTVLEDWALAVDRAAEEHIIKDEYRTLLSSLNPVKGEGEANIVLYGDGDVVISLDSGSRIETTADETDELLSLLSAFDPGGLFVYDLTGGRYRELLSGIRKMFGERALFFVNRNDR